MSHSRHPAHLMIHEDACTTGGHQLSDCQRFELKIRVLFASRDNVFEAAADFLPETGNRRPGFDGSQRKRDTACTNDIPCRSLCNPTNTCLEGDRSQFTHACFAVSFFSFTLQRRSQIPSQMMLLEAVRRDNPLLRKTDTQYAVCRRIVQGICLIRARRSAPFFVVASWWHLDPGICGLISRARIST